MPRPERMHADGAGNGEAANRKAQRMGMTVSTTRTIGVRVMLVRLGQSKDVVAGQMRVFDVAGTKVNVASVGGHLYAFDDTCTHMGCSLGKGTLNDTTVTCSCHGSQDEPQYEIQSDKTDHIAMHKGAALKRAK